MADELAASAEPVVAAESVLLEELQAVNSKRLALASGRRIVFMGAWKR
jgi:hypothetical protein